MLIKIKFSQKCLPLEINSKTIDLIEKLDSVLFTIKELKYNLGELEIKGERDANEGVTCSHCFFNQIMNSLYNLDIDFILESTDYSIWNCDND